MTLVERKKRIQLNLGFKGREIDGDFGPKTISALERKLEIEDVKFGVWPRDTVEAITEHFGKPGDESNLGWFKMPYPMRLFSRDGQILTKHRCHHKVVTSLESILEEARDQLGMDFIREHDLDLYFGCYNHRKMRGRSRSLSRHSWGIAIDLAAGSNGFNTPWPSQATMPVAMIEVFEKHGWKSGARAWGKDAMHFQATQ